MPAIVSIENINTKQIEQSKMLLTMQTQKLNEPNQFEVKVAEEIIEISYCLSSDNKRVFYYGSTLNAVLKTMNNRLDLSNSQVKQIKDRYDAAIVAFQSNASQNKE